MLQPTTTFSLEKHTGPYETWGATSELLVDGESTGKRVPGFVIEGQYAWNSGYLLITSFDCPFEESLEFLFLDCGLCLLCKKRLGEMYASYLLMDNRLVGDHDIELEFADKGRWRLQVRPNRWPAFRRLRLRRLGMA